MARSLKVFRTAIGFHDAYVAATSQKAALEAWGSTSNLFNTGLAERVTDPLLSKAPLERPGEVIKVRRGTDREHLAALPKSGARSPGAKSRKQPTSSKVKMPRPSRRVLDRAEQAVASAEAERDKAIASLDQEIAALQVRRRDVAECYLAKIGRLDEKRALASERYDSAISAWRDG